MDAPPDVAVINKELADCSTLFKELEASHEEHKSLVDAIHKLESDCVKKILKAKKLSGRLLKDVKNPAVKVDDRTKHIKHLKDMQEKITSIVTDYPIDTTWLISFILGPLKVCMPYPDERFNYKKTYEVYKLRITYAILALSSIILFRPIRILESTFNFVLMGYYLIVTLREHILLCNGSRIRRWWRLHHYLACIQSGVLFSWPNGENYDAFRSQFMLFSLYVGLVQLMQYRYQEEALYRKRALGQSQLMETTTDLPNNTTYVVVILALAVAYMFQLYNAVTLYNMLPAAEWQVPVLAFIYLVLAVGNIRATYNTSVNKYREYKSKKES
eukprot:m.124427 g.124427  ORF g.124427 m.124427 type:complete len:329 (+) comp17283_c0_seq1:153-1139(+)